MTGQNIAIIGAGLAGSVLARTLHDAGAQVMVFEKSGGTGGRLATRRTDHGAFNHGAQYLSAKHAAFRAMLTGLARADAAEVWTPHDQDRDAVWHVGKPGMSGVVKPLLKDINVVSRTRVTAIIKDETKALLNADGASLGQFDHVIVTAPTPQAYDLLSPVDPVFQSLASVRYAPNWTFMSVFEGTDIVPDFARGTPADIIGWQAVAFRAAGNLGIVVQAGAEWSRDHLELEKDDAGARILAALQNRHPSLGEPLHVDAHRWRYALVERPLGTPFLGSRCNTFFASGDGMLGGRAESAFESARALADHLKSAVLAPNSG